MIHFHHMMCAYYFIIENYINVSAKQINNMGFYVFVDYICILCTICFNALMSVFVNANKIMKHDFSRKPIGCNQTNI